MSNRITADSFNGRPAGRAARRTTRRLRTAPVLVALICALLAIASVTILQPNVEAPAMIG
jgi:hypothetical protein